MKIDADQILANLQEETSDKKPVSFYLSESMVEKFKSSCGDVPFSKVMEKLMEIFVQSKTGSSDKKWWDFRSLYSACSY